MMKTNRLKIKLYLVAIALVALMAASFVSAGVFYRKAHAEPTELQLTWGIYEQGAGYNIIYAHVPNIDLTTCDFSDFGNVKLKQLGTGVEYSLSEIENPTFPNCLQQGHYESGNHGINFLIPISETFPNLFGYTLEITDSIDLSSEYTIAPFSHDIGILEVADVFTWMGGAHSVTVLMDINNPNWDLFDPDLTFVYPETPNIHSYFTVNGIRYNSAAGSYYMFEEYPAVNLYLQVVAFGGPLFGYPSETVVCLFFMYGTNGEGEQAIPNDTVLVVDGPVFNYLGEPYLKETVTYQKYQDDWHKVSAITLTAPTKDVYQINETLDTTGAQINITYTDGTTARAIDYADELTNTEITGFDSATPGNKTAYVNYHGVQLPFDYTVEAPAGDIFASNFAYSGTQTAHTVSMSLTAEITAENATDMAEYITVSGDGRTVAEITGATVAVDGTTLTVSIPKSEIADFYGKGVALAEDFEVSAGTAVKPFAQTFEGSALELTEAVFFPNFQEGQYQLSLIAITGDPLKGNYADFSVLADAVKVIGGNEPVAISDIAGAYFDYPGDGYLWVYVPASAYPSFAGYGLQLDSSATLPSLDKLAPFKYISDGTGLYKETYIVNALAHGAAGLRFNIYMPGCGNSADAVDLGTDGNSLHANLTINGQQNRFTFAEYPDMTIWMSGQGLGAAAWGLGDTDTYCVIVFSYEAYVFGEAGVRNFVEGTFVRLGKNFNINGYILDRDYTYQLVRDGGGLVWKEVVSVSASAPDKTTYYVSEPINTAGIKITVNYADSTSAVIDYGAYCSIEDFDNINGGEDKVAYVNYRGVKVPFNYTIELVAGEINATGMAYSADENNYYMTLGLNGGLPAADYSALKDSVKIGETFLSDIEGAEIVYDGENGFKFVITVPKTSLSLTGSFTVSLAEDYVIMEGSTLKAFSWTYETSVLTLVIGGFFPNFQEAGYHIALIAISGDPIKTGYNDLSDLENAVKIVKDGEKVAISDTDGGHIEYLLDPVAGGYLWIYIPVSDYPSFDGCYIVLEETAVLPSLDSIAPFGYVVYGNGIFTETYIVNTMLQPADADVKTANIRFNIYMPGHGNDALFDLGTEGHSLHDNLTINGQKTRFTFAEYPGIEFWLGSQYLGSKNLGNTDFDGIGILLFLYGSHGEGPRNFPEGTIVTLGKNFNVNGYILDRDYTYQLILKNGELAWVEVTSVSLTQPTVEFYAVGEELDKSDVKVKVIYADGSEKVYDLTADASVTFNGFDNTQVGENTVTVGYHGYEFAFDCSVKEITGYTVVSEPTKTVYKVGEVINLNGLVIKINFGADAFRTVNFGASELPKGFTVSGFDTANPVENLAINVYYGEALAATVNVRVDAPVVESITITEPTKLEYWVGEEIDLTGGSLKPYFDTGVYGDDIALTAQGVAVSGFDSSAPGTITITVSYENVSETFEVLIKAIVITYVDGTAPVSATYNKDEDKLNLNGGHFTVYYSDGSSREIALNDEQVSFEFDKAATGTTVVVSAFYGQYSFTFNADVVKATEKKGGCGSNIAATESVLVIVLALAAFAVVKTAKRKSENK
ncbi:MAG: bacterial Ig-like domain-containing protein [Clostridia bacterium]|nr:bacterial Ig-like domain-containing protein [Clostridia bacterium]